MYLTFTSPTIEIYFREIRKNKSLTRDEEISLFTRIAKGDKSAETIIFNKMSKLAVMMAKTYTGDPDLLEDLIQEANIGILNAINKYDPESNFRFSTYARWWMKAGITFFLNRLGIVYSNDTRMVNLVKKIRSDFYKKNHREISEYEILEELESMGEMVKDVNVILDTTVSRIDEETDDEKPVSEFGEFAEKTSVDNDVNKEIEKESIAYQVKKYLDILSERDKTMVMMFFGIGRDQEMTYNNIAEEWNKGKSEKEQLTSERVRQIINQSIKKMKYEDLQKK